MLLYIYLDNSITCSKCENISARNDAGARGFELGLGVVDGVVALYAAILRRAPLGARAGDEDGAVAALDEAVVEEHPE